MNANGKNAVVACLALCIGWCLAQPTRVSVTVPDHVAERLGDVDEVTIPGGGLLVGDDGTPVVPYFIRSVPIPEGYRVLDVELKGRSGMKTESGLRLPIAQPDLGPAAKVISMPFPEEEFGWSAVYEGGSPMLHLFVNAVVYNPKTTELVFHKEYEFGVSYARSAVRIVAVVPGQGAYEPGDEMELTVLIENRGDARDAVLTVHAGRHAGPKASVEVASQVVQLGTSDSVVLKWQKSGAATGVYDVEVVVRDTDGNELDRNGTILRIGTPRGEVAAFRVEPEVFRVGDNIKLTLEFKNTGSCVLEGEAVFRVSKQGELVEELRAEMTRTKPGESRTFRKSWSTAGAEKSVVYTVVGFVEFEGMACDPARAMFSTNRMPDAAFADLPDSVAVGEEVLFDASGSKDADGEIVEYRWDFGDGGKAEGATASHGWMQLGEFVVRLSVVDNEGGAGTVTRVVVVGE